MAVEGVQVGKRLEYTVDEIRAKRTMNRATDAAAGSRGKKRSRIAVGNA